MTASRVATLAASVLIVVLWSGCGASAGPVASSSSSPRSANTPHPPLRVRHTPRAGHPAARLGQPTRATGCRVRGPLPDPSCTPGSVFTTATPDQLCRPGYARSVRDVSEETRLAVYAAYGIARGEGAHFELDHLIPLELGGDNTQANLWPEAAPRFGAKDQVENELHDAVCAGGLSLRSAQRRMARDWRRAGSSIGVSVVPPPAATAPGASSPAGQAPQASGSFCATHRCIPSFARGHGTIVQCADGEWSHSGGRAGVCSDHGGPRRG